MKKILNKLMLLSILTTLIFPAFNVIAEELDDETNSVVTSENVEESEPTTGEEGETGEEENGSDEEEDATKGEAYLDSLNIYYVGKDGNSTRLPFNEKFQKDKFNYTTTVVSTSKIESVSVDAGAVSGTRPSIVGTGIQKLSSDSKVTVKVTSENGKVTNTYTVTIVKATSNLNLKSLSIKGIPFDFSADQTNYSVEVSYNVPTISIEAVQDDSKCEVTGTGSKKLDVGENTIKIVVKNEAGQSKTYKIVVNRLSEDESLGDPDDIDGSVVSSDLDDSVTENVSKSVDSIIPIDNDQDDNGDMFRNILISVICFILLLIAGLGIYFYIVTGKSEKNRQRKIAKLVKKQAKIEEQLTGLMPVITEEQIKGYANNSSNRKEDKPVVHYADQDVDVPSTIDNEDIESELSKTIEIEVQNDDNDINFDFKSTVAKDDSNDNSVGGDLLDDFDYLFDE